MRHSGQACAYRHGVEGIDWAWQRQGTGESARANKAQPHTHWKSGENLGKEKGLKQQRPGTAPGRQAGAADENTGPAQCEVEMFT